MQSSKRACEVTLLVDRGARGTKLTEQEANDRQAEVKVKWSCLDAHLYRPSEPIDALYRSSISSRLDSSFFRCLSVYTRASGERSDRNPTPVDREIHTHDAGGEAMSSWDGRCKRCHRLMSICKCFVTGGGGGDQNSNPNGFSSSRSDDDTSYVLTFFGRLVSLDTHLLITHTRTVLLDLVLR